MSKSHLKKLYSEYTQSFNQNNQVCEITSIQIKNLINERLEKSNLSHLSKIYGFENGCPVCTNDYTKENWIVLHPCGHLLCNDCLNNINEIVQQEGILRKCPMCRRRCKWMGPNDDNLRTFSSPNSIPNWIPNTNSYLNRSNSYRFQIIDDDISPEFEEILLNSLPPLNLLNQNAEIDEKEPLIKSEISTTKILIDNQERKIGNLSLRAKELKRENQGIDLVVIMDVSGSMSNVAEDCKNILKETIQSVSSIDRLSIIVFDDCARQLFPLQPMTNQIKDDCKFKIDNCFTGGSTNFESAIKLLIKVKNDGILSNRPFKVIFVSDGQPDPNREGYQLISQIYEGEVKPELFSCTFGINVKADIMQKFLSENNQHYYNHIPDMNSFHNLISKIGIDRNIIIGQNIKIILSGIEPETSLNYIKENKQIIIRIDSIRTGEILSIPLLYSLDNSNSEEKIEVHYDSLNQEKINLGTNEVEVIGDFILNHFWYRRLTKMIKELKNGEEDLKKLNEISLLSTSDKLGPFLNEIKDLVNEARNMLTIQNQGYHHYNTYTSSVQRVVSYTSPSVQTFYRSSSLPY